MTKVARYDRDALAEIYRRHGPMVYGLASRLCGTATAENVSAEVFLSLWQRPEDFVPSRECSLRSLLLAAAHRQSIEVLRAGVAADGDSRIADVDQDALAPKLDPDVVSVLLDLPEAHRHAVVLAYFVGLTAQQIASRLDRPVENVNVDIRAGLVSLGQAIQSRPDVEHQLAGSRKAITTSTNDEFDQARQAAQLTHAELWLRYFALGGVGSPLDLEALLYGALQPSGHEHDVIAHALNERFMELGSARRVAYPGDDPEGIFPLPE